MRLAEEQPGIAAFDLWIHERTGSGQFRQQALRKVSEDCPDDAALAGSILPGKVVAGSTYDPLALVAEAVGHWEKSFSEDAAPPRAEPELYSGPIPSYSWGGRTVRRWFECVVYPQPPHHRRLLPVGIWHELPPAALIRGRVRGAGENRAGSLTAAVR